MARKTVLETTYTFTPNAGQCVTGSAQMTVTVNPSTTPTFTQVAAICAGGSFTLPTTGSNKTYFEKNYKENTSTKLISNTKKHKLKI